ncbi:cellulose biosynthesis protein BcsQ [Pseudomonas saudiphocaensis]|uniref:cellulose biosynthesis protein BcsQ n=1 Tax=Pseudomonas saudiphocaensis TaxID=1499686 RepID=UPI000F7BABDE|nr:cellulose biosynthesis protein BcsQ [Pseudomonas saudiphocaensis]RRV17402.1 cellulose synthase operon protein YhjQ [Pseudomonas saudiphocaensis]
MPLICVTSPKGGVGKTTLTANLAYALQRLGHPVVVIDFDVQNALRLHLGIQLNDGRGYVAHAPHQLNWSRLSLTTQSGIRVLPYGDCSAEASHLFERHLRESPNFLAEALRDLLAVPGLMVLADTPPGPTAALDALDRIADFRIVVLLADSGSVSQLPKVMQGGFFRHSRSGLGSVGYIINQVDRRRRLNQDITEFLRARLGGQVLGMVHRDEALAEALATQQTVFTFEPTTAAAHDIDQVARRLVQQLEHSQAYREASQY